MWNLYGILYRKPLYHIHKPHTLCYQQYRFTGILTLSLTSDSGPINKLLNEIYKPTLDFAAWCLDIQNRYSCFPIPKVPTGFLIPWRNTCQPPSQTPSDINWYSRFPHPESPDRTFFIPSQPPSQPPAIVTTLVRAIKKPARRSEREKHNNMLTTIQYSQSGYLKVSLCGSPLHLDTDCSAGYSPMYSFSLVCLPKDGITVYSEGKAS